MNDTYLIAVLRLVMAPARIPTLTQRILSRMKRGPHSLSLGILGLLAVPNAFNRQEV